MIEDALGRVAGGSEDQIDGILDADARARRAAAEVVNRLLGQAA